MTGIPASPRSESARSVKVPTSTSQEKIKLTPKRAVEVFGYLDGNLFWKVQTSNRTKKGDICGCINGKGYRVTRLHGQLYYNHRIVWLLHHGYFPENDIDHINRDRSDNRVENLREVSRTCNLRNSTDNTGQSGIRGVYWNSRDSKWKVQININGRVLPLGQNKCLIEAACMRLAAEQSVNWGDCGANTTASRYVKKYLEEKRC